MRCAHRPACRGQRFALPTTQTFDHNYTASYYLHELRTPESYRGDNYSDAGEPAQRIALQVRDLARAGVAASGLDDVGQFARGVVHVALVAAIEADLVGEVVGRIVGEPGVRAVLVGQCDEPFAQVVVVAQHAAARASVRSDGWPEPW